MEEKNSLPSLIDSGSSDQILLQSERHRDFENTFGKYMYVDFCHLTKDILEKSFNFMYFPDLGSQGFHIVSSPF